MNIRDLEYIVAVDELKSFIKASKKCFVSQPALSMQIQKAENLLGVKIFERTRKSIITTAEGQKVIDCAKEIIKTFEFIKSIKNDGSQIKIGIIHTISPYLLPKIITPIQADFADVKMFFIEGKTKELLESLSKGDLDAVILSSSSDSSLNIKKFNTNNITFEPLYKEKFLLTVSSNHTLNGQKKLTADQFKDILTKEKIIMLEEGHCMTDDLGEICRYYNMNAEKTKDAQFFATSIETIKHMIKLGNGISILPKLSVNGTEDGFCFIELPEEEFRTVNLVFRKNTSKGNILSNISKVILSSVGPEVV